MDGYTNEEHGKLRQKLTYYQKVGHPEWANRLQLQIDAQVPFFQIELPEDIAAGESAQIHPETQVAVHLLELPPRQGTGSSADTWRAFARMVSNITTDVLDNMGRDDIVSILEDRGIIPPVEVPPEEADPDDD